MSQRLTDTIVKGLEAPPSGNKIHYDAEMKGFGIRVTANGAKSFILNYRTNGGRERRFTIGAYPAWKVAAARAEAAELRKRVDRGEDPLAEIEADRNAKTVRDLCERFTKDHLPKTRPNTESGYRIIIDREILPELQHRKVADVTFSDIDELHRKITKRGATYQANRTVAVLSKMFSLAIRWEWRTDNPCRGVEKNQEVKRHRYLSPAELGQLTGALTGLADQQGADIIRLLLLTGARRGEVLAAKWEQFDIEAGVWTKPGSTTKQKTLHRVPLSAPARLLLANLRAKAGDDAEYVFPSRRASTTSEAAKGSRGKSGPRVDIKRAWRQVCIDAGITEARQIKGRTGKVRTVVEPSARIHDLRHTYASMLASAGMSLPIIGALLGHSQPSTTARYSHLMDDPLRQATERVGAIVMPKGDGAEVFKLKDVQ